jgi:hypothetical protein
MASFREDSKKHWNSDTSVDQINAGSLQRIADATELMAVTHVALQEDRDRYKRWYQDSEKTRKYLLLSNAALKGQITKLNKALAAIGDRTAAAKEISCAASQRLHWAQNSLNEITEGGGESLVMGKTHIHNAIEILKQVPVGN